MISIDDDSPSDPSSSHHHHQQHQQQHKSHNLKVSDIDLKSTVVAHDLDDSNNPLPNFSIRDYVYSIRNKDISCNWPFTSTSLQLCLKHGVKNLLPPFQSLDSLRNNSSLGRCNPKIYLTNQELESGFNGMPTSDESRSSKEIVSTSSSDSKQDKESQFYLQRHSGQTKSKDKPPVACQKPENASVNTTMTSKVCPVCKVFSSSSNTTLNAHIDQCLTGEGTMKWSESPKVIVKHKVKPRKMRLMLDIYKTASHCTVEELDRRNGTSWATNSNFAAQECQFQEEEEEKDEPRLTKVNPVIADNEGDVYIDSNGTKVRVLSVPKTVSSDNQGGRKSLIMSKKKNSLYKKKPHKKYLKLSQNAGKLCLPKPQARRSLKEDVMAEICSKDEQSKENKRVVNLGIIRPPWACSKRTGGSRKLNRTKDSVVDNHDKSFAECDLASSQSGSKVRTSLSLIKQRINLTVDCRKEGSREDYDDDDSSQSQHSDDDDEDFDDDSSQSQHSKDNDDTRSNVGKFSSLSKKGSFPVVKFCFKRKFSAVDESGVKFVGGPSHDSSKEQCETEEYGSAKKKQQTKSITSKSSSNEESLVEIQTANEQSVTNGTSSSIAATSFTRLSTSFDPEFQTHEGFELYQDQLCSTNRALNDKQDNYFQEVDPIPIPGPPGSFLPASPGGETVSEVQIQDQDSMSNSPVSTVSNSRSSYGKDETYKKPLFNGDTGFTESGQSQERFKNDPPCCCSRKEAAALNYQDLYNLRKQPVESNTSTPSSLNHYGSEMFSSAAVGPSKPVLRLMGKNLTLVKTDEHEFRQPRPSQHPQRSANFSQCQNDFEYQHFNVDPPRSHIDFGPIQLGPTRSHYVPNGLGSQSVNGRNEPVKEIIILDDSPENEDDNTRRNKFSKGNYGQMNALYTMYPSNSRVNDGSLVFRSGSFQTSSANGDAASKWNTGSSATCYPPTYP